MILPYSVWEYLRTSKALLPHSIEDIPIGIHNLDYKKLSNANS